MIKIDYNQCCWKNGKCSSNTCGCGSGNCNGCAEVCPVGAIKRRKKVEVDNKKCLNCGACIEACTHRAISLVQS
jgi:formate hydrogenlyase subunit 6/NADH:ubiquinone oxidoreductase subunit I